MGSELVDTVGLINMLNINQDNEERIAKVRRLIAGGADLEARDHMGRTALHVIIQGCMGKIPMGLAHDLLDAGARADVADDRGESILTAAAGARGEHFDDPEYNAGLLELVQRLVAAGSPVENGPESPVAAAVWIKREALALWLLEQGGSAQGIYQGRPAIETAAGDLRSPLSLLEALMNAGAEPSTMALFEAVQAGRAEAVELLLERGASVDASFQTDDGRTFLHAAAKSGDLALTEEILATKPKKSVLDAKHERTKRTALMLALHEGHGAIALRLLDAKPKIKGSDNQRYTVLHLAALANLEGLIQPLLDRGAEPDKVDYDKRSPLHIAAFHGHAKVARALLATGHYGPDQADRDGDTPRKLAKLNGHDEVLALFDEA